MMTIYKVAELITKNPNDIIFYIIDKEEVITFPHKDYKKLLKNYHDESISQTTFETLARLKLENDNNFYILPYFTKKDLTKIVNEFVSLHQNDYFQNFKSITITQIKKNMLNDSSFKDCWINFFCDLIGIHFLKFAEAFKIKEDEASPELYKKVVDLLKEYEEGHYEKIFADNHRFNLFFDKTFGADALCTIMGHGGITNGISFYIHEKAEAMHILLTNDNNDLDDYYVPTLTFLGKQITFYFNDESCATNNDKFGSLNPFGDDDSITSFVTYVGTSYHCYLTASMAHGVIRYLTKLLLAMKDFVKEAKKLDLEDTTYDFIMVDEQTHVTPIDTNSDDFVDDITIDLPTAKIFDKKKKIKLKTNKKWDFAVRFVPGANVAEETGRICDWVFYYCFFDHDSGDIVRFEMVPPEFMDTISTLIDNLTETLHLIGLADTVYCSSFFDAAILSLALGKDNDICKKFNFVFTRKLKDQINTLSESLMEEFDKEADA